MWHTFNVHLRPQVSSSGWRSSLLSSSWNAWIYGTESSQSHLPAAEYLKLVRIRDIVLIRTSIIWNAKCSTTDLLDSDADSDRVDGALNQDFLLVISADDHRLEEQLFTTSGSERNTHNPLRSHYYESTGGWSWIADFMHCWLLFTAPKSTHRTSTSGLLCLSTTCEEKFSRQRAACKVARTALRYGRKVAVWGAERESVWETSGSTGRSTFAANILEFL